ncbi:hypothetical protein OAD79_01185 [Flavobacteriales bacterium]|nr:hypothetical protein [Flavobacteriales bacterium]
MKRINFLTIILLMAMPLFYQSQIECYNTVSFCDTESKQGFTRNMQSLSGAFTPGDTSIVQIIVYKNMEYRVSLCSPSHPDLEGKFQFKIIEEIKKGVWKENTIEVDSTDLDDEPVTDMNGNTLKISKTQRKRVFETTQEVRYDNSEHEMSQDFIFTSNKTRKLKIKVYVPSTDSEEMSSGLSGITFACVGLLLEHQPGVVTGFKR